jgi:hypothetical protein
MVKFGAAPGVAATGRVPEQAESRYGCTPTGCRHLARSLRPPQHCTIRDAIAMIPFVDISDQLADPGHRHGEVAGPSASAVSARFLVRGTPNHRRPAAGKTHDRSEDTIPLDRGGRRVPGQGVGQSARRSS